MKFIITSLVVFGIFNQSFASSQLISDYKEQYLRTLNTNPNDGSYVAAELVLTDLEEKLSLHLTRDQIEALKEKLLGLYNNNLNQQQAITVEENFYFELGILIDSIQKNIGSGDRPTDLILTLNKIDQLRPGFTDMFFKSNMRAYINPQYIRALLSLAAASLANNKVQEEYFLKRFSQHYLDYAKMTNPTSLAADIKRKAEFLAKSIVELEINNNNKFLDRIQKAHLLHSPKSKNALQFDITAALKGKDKDHIKLLLIFNHFIFQPITLTMQSVLLYSFPDAPLLLKLLAGTPTILQLAGMYSAFKLYNDPSGNRQQLTYNRDSVTNCIRMLKSIGGKI